MPHAKSCVSGMAVAVLLFWTSAVAIASPQVGAASRTAKTHGYPLTVDVLSTFSGGTAVFGQIYDTGCYAGQEAVNTAGGVLGHPVTCLNSDTKGDAADAATVVDKVLASTSHLIGIVGPGTTSSAYVSVIAHTRIPMFAHTTNPRFDHNKNRYFFRILPSDSLAGTALAFWAAKHGYKHAAGVWLTTSSSQTNVVPFKAVYKRLGGKLAGTFSLAPTLTNYRTEALSILGAKPDAIVMDSNPKTAATLFSDLKQLVGNGKLPQVILDSTGETPTFISAVSKVIGIGAVDHFVNVAQATVNKNSSGFRAFYHSLLAVHKKTLIQFAPVVYAYYAYTAIVLDALALTGNHTLVAGSPNVIASFKAMTIPGKGKVTVHTYAQGLAALKRGVKVNELLYIGADGTINFNRFNNSSATFEAAHDGPTPSSPLVQIGAPISRATLTHLLSKTGL